MLPSPVKIQKVERKISRHASNGWKTSEVVFEVSLHCSLCNEAISFYRLMFCVVIVAVGTVLAIVVAMVS